ncbi:MAG: TetR/AcrR family transcriptional regulator [Acidimicrobiia bacterium]|nr:TetR/AcrR family transcriptional regulator [Acidimicrobiia bacterium]
MRHALIERAAELLARREPVTLRSLVAGTGASTMAVYTHFGGMPGLWRAVRQEGFTRLTARLQATGLTRDPVRDLAALGAAYAANALANPDLYRAMFDARVDLEDAEAAAASFDVLVVCVERAQEQGRFAADVHPEATATRYWATGHGLTSLAVSGVLPSAALAEHAPAVAVALFVAAGDDPARASRSVHAGWRGVELP